MPKDAELDKWRQSYVATWLLRRGTEALKQVQEIECAQKTVLILLKSANFDRIVRSVFVGFELKYRATKIAKDSIPLDGKPVKDLCPAFIICKPGLQPNQIPGAVYLARHELDEIAVSVTICRGNDGCVFPYFRLTHRDGRTHNIDWESSLVNPSDDQLKHFLENQIKRLLKKELCF